MNGDEVGIIIGEGQGEDVAMAHLQMTHSRVLDRGAGDRQHFAARIDADADAPSAARRASDAAGSGAEVEMRTQRPLAGEVLHRRLDLFFANVEGSQVLPIRGIGPEKGGGTFAPRLADLFETGGIG